MSFFKKDEIRLLWPFYLDSLLSPILFFAPAFFVVYFAGLNLTYLQIGVLFAVAPLASIFFEIPTGAIADLYGRKFSVLLGFFLEGICALLLFFIKDYYSMLFIFIIWGIVSTFSSGSGEAWIIDLINKKNKKLIQEFFNKRQIFDSFALIISGIIGALLVKSFGLSIIWPVAAASYFLAVFIRSFGKEYYKKNKLKIKELFRKLHKQTRETISYGYSHHVLYYYLIASFLLIFTLNFTGGLAIIPFLKELNFPDYAFGYMWSALAFVTMISPLISKRLLVEGQEKKFIMICLGLSAFFILFILLSNTWIFALIILLIEEFLIALRIPASRIYFHRFIPSKLRATMGSVEGMLLSLSGAIAIIIAGYSIDVIGAKYTILLYTPLMAIVIWVYSKIKEENNMKQKN